jgi:PTS system nitrogen regulatory IIA component
MIQPQQTRDVTAPADTLAQLLDQGRITSGLTVSSKKRLLEEITRLLVTDTMLDPKKVFQVLTERERLGSTGIGEGVALPHGRMEGLDHPIGAFASLNEPIDYDAQDGKPVNLVFGLLVPTDAQQEHLNILANLARLFSDSDLRDRLAHSTDDGEILSCLTESATRRP